jgi:hypothetical protein
MTGEASGPSLHFERAHHSDFAQATIHILPFRRRYNDHDKAEHGTAPVCRIQTVLSFGNVCFLLAQKWPGHGSWFSVGVELLQIVRLPAGPGMTWQKAAQSFTNFG